MFKNIFQYRMQITAGKFNKPKYRFLFNLHPWKTFPAQMNVSRRVGGGKKKKFRYRGERERSHLKLATRIITAEEF